jgi:hypothetical protein
MVMGLVRLRDTQNFTCHGSEWFYAASLARSPALLAFGGDSAVELLSAVVVLWRFRAHAVSGHAERNASRIAGALLFALAVYVSVVSVMIRACGGGWRWGSWFGFVRWESRCYCGANFSDDDGGVSTALSIRWHYLMVSRDISQDRRILKSEVNSPARLRSHLPCLQ